MTIICSISKILPLLFLPPLTRHHAGNRPQVRRNQIMESAPRLALIANDYPSKRCAGIIGKSLLLCATALLFATCSKDMPPPISDCEIDCSNRECGDDGCGGVCGYCNEGDSCHEGSCVRSCPDGQIDCDGICILPATDPDNCGGCGNICDPDERCEEGLCVPLCGPGLTYCSGHCVDLQSNIDNCGECGTACVSDEVCEQGVCAAACRDGLVQCGNDCVDISSNPSHCGGCDIACESNELCADGVCVPDCMPDCPEHPDPVDCEPFVTAGYEVCEVRNDRCEVAFSDGIGCADLCAIGGLACGRVYERVDPFCRPDHYRPELSCEGTGHGSDVCHCVDAETCRPDCEGRECGSDGCGGTCGTCNGGLGCVQGECVDDVPITVEGFGRSARGGFQPGMQVLYVTSLADAGPGTLRSLLDSQDQPRWIRFAEDGVINLETSLSLPSNITVDGRGRRVTIRQKGFVIHGRQDVILTHLAVEDVVPDNMDGVQIGTGTPGTEGHPSERVVINNMRFSQHGELGDSNYTDEAISVIYGSTDVTISNNVFETIEKVILIGNGDAPAHVDQRIRVTVHGNHFLNTGRRHPRARYGRIDVYNNFLDDWRMFGPAEFTGNWRRAFGIWCHDGCEMIVEQNVFLKHPHPHENLAWVEWPKQATRCAPGFTDVSRGAIDDRGSYIPPESTSPLEFNVGCNSSDAVFVRPYDATIRNADDDLIQYILDNAGPGF